MTCTAIDVFTAILASVKATAAAVGNFKCDIVLKGQHSSHKATAEGLCWLLSVSFTPGIWSGLKEQKGQSATQWKSSYSNVQFE